MDERMTPCAGRPKQETKADVVVVVVAVGDGSDQGQGSRLLWADAEGLSALHVLPLRSEPTRACATRLLRRCSSSTMIITMLSSSSISRHTMTIPSSVLHGPLPTLKGTCSIKPEHARIGADRGAPASTDDLNTSTTPLRWLDGFMHPTAPPRTTPPVHPATPVCCRPSLGVSRTTTRWQTCQHPPTAPATAACSMHQGAGIWQLPHRDAAPIFLPSQAQETRPKAP